MGYTTDFNGALKFSRTLTVKEKKVLDDFNEERHGGNTEPFAGFPGFWCQWRPTDDGEYLEWDGGEKFYDYVAWLNYLIANFVEPWGLTLNGSIEWQGEESDDLGRIDVNNNVVTTKQGKVIYE